jgi:hypothetical protein
MASMRWDSDGDHIFAGIRRAMAGRYGIVALPRQCNPFIPPHGKESLQVIDGSAKYIALTNYRAPVEKPLGFKHSSPRIG